MAGISLTARPFNWIATIRKGPNAIHGFVRSLLWNIAEVTPSRVSLNVTINRDSYAARGYPFSLELQLSYSLDQLGYLANLIYGTPGPHAHRSEWDSISTFPSAP